MDIITLSIVIVSLTALVVTFGVPALGGLLEGTRKHYWRDVKRLFCYILLTIGIYVGVYLVTCF